jgi:hypothetical protein
VDKETLLAALQALADSKPEPKDATAAERQRRRRAKVKLLKAEAVKAVKAVCGG